MMKEQLVGKYGNARGMGTIEILIAFAIFTLTMGALITLVFGNQTVSTDTQISDEALYKAQALVEQARALASQDFTQVQSISTTTDSIYQKSVNVQDLDSTTKQLLALVSWTSGGRTLYTRVMTLLTSPSVAACNATVANPLAWKTPQHWDFSGSSLTGNNSNGLGFSDMRVYKQKLYVTADATDNSNNTFYVFSLPADPSQMPTLGNNYVDNAQGITAGLNAVAVASSGSTVYAYVSNAYTGASPSCTEAANCAEIQIINATGVPFVARNFKIPATTVSNKLPASTAVYYAGGYLYVGLSKVANNSANGEFVILDVGGGSGSPTAPVLLGTYPTGSTINSIYVSGNYAYVTTDDNGTPNKQLLVIDISKKNLNPLPLSSYFQVAGAGFGRVVTGSGNQIYLGRSYLANSPTLYVLNASTPTVTPLPSLTSNSGTSNISSIVIRSTLAFILTSSQFQVWDVTTPSAITPWTTTGSAADFMTLSSLGGSGTSFNCSGNYFYTAIASSQGNSKDSISVIGPGATTPTISLAVHDSAHTSITTAVSGSSVHGSATVTDSTGSPTGTVAFTYYSNASCTGLGTSAGTATLANGVADPSSATGALAAGSYSFKAHYNGNYAYSAIDSACVPFTVSKANQTITVTTHAPLNAVYNTTFPVAANSDSGLTVAITTTGSCTISGGVVSITSAATSCIVHYNQAGNSSYNQAPEVIETTATVKATPTLSVTNSPQTYTGSSKTASVSGSVPGVVSSIKYNGSATAPTNAGTYAVTANFTPTDAVDYSTLVGSSAGNFVISLASQTITFTAPGAKNFGDADFVVSASASSGLTVTFSSQTSSVCSVAGTSVHLISAGSCIIRASQAGNTNYTAAPNVDRPFTVNKATPNISTVIYNNATGLPISPAPAGPIAKNTVVFDKAILTGVAGVTPTGTVNFTFSTKKTNCGSPTQGAPAAAVTLSGGIAQSSLYTTASNDTVSWQVQYNGDSNYNAVSAVCEPLNVNP